MINNISEGAVRIAAKLDPGGLIHEREFSQHRADVIRQARPVEKSESGNRARERKPKEEDSSRYVVDGNQIIFEKYDQKGDLILSIPPSHKPVDERA